MYEGEDIPEGIFSEAFPTPPEASIYPPWRRSHMLQRCVEACYAEAHREERREREEPFKLWVAGCLAIGYPYLLKYLRTWALYRFAT